MAKRRLADEYDAAQERGEVQKHGGQGKRDVPEQNIPPATAADIGLTRKDIHEARIARDAEINDPGITKRTVTELLDAGHEPTKAALRQAPYHLDLGRKNCQRLPCRANCVGEAMAFGSRQRAAEEHRAFRLAFAEGRCCMCSADFRDYQAGNPCLHWLTHPAGFRKRDIPAIADRYSLFETQLFLRWLANEEAPACNINDLAEEGGGRPIELTIRYRDCEWALSASEGDLAGHDGAGEAANRPHYHLQMRYRRQVITKFNDFHLPLHTSDIEALTKVKDGETINFAGGAGFSDFLYERPIEDLLRGPFVQAHEEEGMLEFSTIIIADSGELLKGEHLAAMIDRARQGKTSFADIAHQTPELDVRTIISPGRGLVEQSVRSGRKKR